MDTPITKEMVASLLDEDNLQGLIFYPGMVDRRMLNSLFIVCDEEIERAIKLVMEAKSSTALLFKTIRFYRWEELEILPRRSDFSYHVNELTKDEKLGKIHAYWAVPIMLDTKKSGFKA